MTAPRARTRLAVARRCLRGSCVRRLDGGVCSRFPSKRKRRRGRPTPLLGFIKCASSVGACVSARSRARGRQSSRQIPCAKGAAPSATSRGAICQRGPYTVASLPEQLRERPHPHVHASARRGRVFAVAGKSNGRSFGSRAPAACTSAEMPASGYTRRMRRAA